MSGCQQDGRKKAHLKFVTGLEGDEGRRKEDKHMSKAWQTGGLKRQGGERLVTNGHSFIPSVDEHLLCPRSEPQCRTRGRKQTNKVFITQGVYGNMRCQL